MNRIRMELFSNLLKIKYIKNNHAEQFGKYSYSVSPYSPKSAFVKVSFN